MKRLIDPYSSLAPAGGEFRVGYSVVLACCVICAIGCGYGITPSASFSILTVMLYQLRDRPFMLLGLDRNASPSGWKDPQMAKIVWALVATFALLIALYFVLRQADDPRVISRALQPSRIPFALGCIIVPASLALMHLRRMSWLASRRSFGPYDEGIKV